VFANALARKRAEQALRQKTEELDQFFNVSLDLLCVANTEGYFLRLNPAWERSLGYSREELTAKRFYEFVHPDDLDRTHKAVYSLASQQRVIHFENRYRCKDGTYRWLEWTSVPAGDLIYAAARDITERKQAEEALEERLQFEGLLSGLSARFVNIPPDRVDSEIEDGLRQILEFFQVDRCLLFRTLPDKASWQITHTASSGNVPTSPAGVELPRSLYPWAYEKLSEKHEVMSISRLDDLPAEAKVDRQTCIEMGIRSYVNIPILIGESVDVIHISSVKSERVWPEELFPRLRLLGEIFVNGLELKRAEEASRESDRMLRQNESDLRELAGRLIYAQEEERRRLARELHDDLAQRLAVVAIDVGRLELQLMDTPAPVREELHEMKNGIVRISQDVHSLSRQLHPSILDDLGLTKAVESECTNFSRREGIEIVFNHENIPRVIPKDVSLSLYRIIQEGLRNISKHACAEHISVSLKGLGHDVLLSVQDDGIGFDSAEVKENPGLGFSSMRERARLIHGEFSIKSQPEKGTLITVRAPLTREGE
jgi:PAS domain S-box-containing protein